MEEKERIMEVGKEENQLKKQHKNNNNKAHI